MPNRVELPPSPRTALRGLLGAIPTMKVYRQVAARLAQELGRESPYTARHLMNMVSGRKPIPEPLGNVLQRIRPNRYSKSGQSVIANQTAVLVHAPPRAVLRGSLVLARSRRCRRRRCRLPFIPRSGNQVYHCRRCGYLDRRGR